MSRHARRTATDEYDFKVVIVGRYGVGKSTLLHRFIYGNFSPYIKPNAREESEDIPMQRENKKVRLRLWDTAGQERFRSLTNSYYRDTNAVILAFDVTNEQSYRDITHWYDDVKNLMQPNGKEVSLALIGTKCHATEKRVVSEENGGKWALEKNMEYMEVSAEDGTNVQMLFETIVDKLTDEHDELRSRAITEIDISIRDPVMRRRRCCFLN